MPECRSSSDVLNGEENSAKFKRATVFILSLGNVVILRYRYTCVYIYDSIYRVLEISQCFIQLKEWLVKYDMEI